MEEHSFFTAGNGTKENTEYSLVFLQNLPNPTFYIYVTTPENWSVPFNISNLGNGFIVNGVARRGKVVTVPLQSPSYVLRNSSEKWKVISVRAESYGRLTVYGGNIQQRSSDTFLALPKQHEVQTSYKYIAASYASNYSDQHNSFTAIIAQYNNTHLSITPKMTATIGDALTLSGTTTSVSLQEGETLLVNSKNDLTGLLVGSNRPIAILSGHECTNVPLQAPSCDHLVEQIPPVSSWGRKFATAPLKGRQAYDVFRILASEDSTMVTVNCTLSANQPTLSKTKSTHVLNEGNFVEFRVSSSQYCLIEGSDNILVLQYSVGGGADARKGDPTMIIVPAVKQYCSYYTLPTIQLNNSSFAFSHYMNIFIPAKYYQPDQVFLDNKLLNRYNLTFKAIYQSGTPQVYAAQVHLTEGVHTLRHANAEATLGVIMYGFGNSTSYGHPGGLNLKQGRVCIKFLVIVCVYLCVCTFGVCVCVCAFVCVCVCCVCVYVCCTCVCVRVCVYVFVYISAHLGKSRLFDTTSIL